MVTEADGGEDTYENCIPLCFDCHAEVRGYDPKHPKGRRFTASELRGHRDRWYEKVNSSQGIIASPDYLQIDRELFTRIREILPSTGAAIDLIRRQDYYGYFPVRDHDDLHKFAHYCETPEFEFLDADLESLRGELESHITKFLSLIGQYTFPLKTDSNFSRIAVLDTELRQDMRLDAKDEEHFKELVRKHEEHVNEVGRELNRLADEICRTYDELIRLGRRKLAV